MSGGGVELVVCAPPGCFLEEQVGVALVHRASADQALRILKRLGVKKQERPVTPPDHPMLFITLPLFIYNIHPVEVHEPVAIPDWLVSSKTCILALETVLERTIHMDSSTLEIEMGFGRLFPDHFKQGITATQFNQWQRNTTKLMIDRVSSWRISKSDEVTDWFTQVCSKCGLRACSHRNSMISVRQRTDSSGTSVVHKITEERMNCRCITWRRAVDVVDIQNRLLRFPSWVHVADVALQLGSTNVTVVDSHTLDMIYPEIVVPRLHNINVPQPFNEVPDCRLRISREEPVKINSLLMPVQFVRKSHREEIVGDSEGRTVWKLVQYMVYEGASEAEVNEKMLPSNPQKFVDTPKFNVELELDVEYMREKQKKHGPLFARIAAVSFLMKLYDFYSVLMKDRDVCLQPVL
jgi:hypothetical protein